MNRNFNVLAAATLIAMGASVANAQTGSGSGTAGLSGEVDGFCELLVGSNTNGATYDMGDLLYGYSGPSFGVTLACNDIDGATLLVTSNNGGLRLDDDPTVVVPYTVSITGFTDGSMSFLSSANSNNSKDEPTSAALRTSGVPLSVSLSGDGTAAEFSGTYSDTLVFNISART